MVAIPVVDRPVTMEPHGRRNFIFYLPRVRYSLFTWLGSLDGRIPTVVFNTLMKSEWDDFFVTGHGLRLGVFAMILYFFEVNEAPYDLRKLFWCWILPRPLFNDRGLAVTGHPYIDLFFNISRLDPYQLACCGAFHRVDTHCTMGYRGSAWRAFNIWGCAGFDVVKRVQFVNTVLKMVDEELGWVDWNSFFLPEMVSVDGGGIGDEASTGALQLSDDEDDIDTVALSDSWSDEFDTLVNFNGLE